MPILDVETGKGLTVNDEGELCVKIDPDKVGDLKVSDKGVWAKGLNGLSDQFVDDWTITSSHSTEEEVNKNIWLNTRVVARCYCYCMLKSKRPFTGDKNFDGERNKRNAMYTIEPRDAINGTGESDPIKAPGDLKDVLDIIREVNFPIIYSKYDWTTNDPTEHDFEPPVILRPGSLIAFSDTIYCSDYGANAMYENGMRMPKLTTFNGYKKGTGSDDEITVSEQPQHIYALFMVTKSQYMEFTAYDNKSKLVPAEANTYQVNPAPFQLLKYLKLKCIWSDQTAFNGLLNTDGWRPGEFMKHYIRDYDNDNSYSADAATINDFGQFNFSVTYQDWPYVNTVFKNTDTKEEPGEQNEETDDESTEDTGS